MGQASLLRERDDFRYLDYCQTHDGQHGRHTFWIRPVLNDCGEHNDHHRRPLAPSRLDRAILIQLGEATGSTKQDLTLSVGSTSRVWNPFRTSRGQELCLRTIQHGEPDKTFSSPSDSLDLSNPEKQPDLNTSHRRDCLKKALDVQLWLRRPFREANPSSSLANPRQYSPHPRPFYPHPVVLLCRSTKRRFRCNNWRRPRHGRTVLQSSIGNGHPCRRPDHGLGQMQNSGTICRDVKCKHVSSACPRGPAPYSVE